MSVNENSSQSFENLATQYLEHREEFQNFLSGFMDRKRTAREKSE